MERTDGKHLNHPRADPVQRAELFEQIWELKREHRTFAQIAEELDISTTTAWKIFHEKRKELIPPAVEQERILALEHLEDAISKCYELLNYSNDIEIKLKVLESLRKLLKDKRELTGVNAAKKFEMKTHNSAPVDEELEELSRQFGLDRADAEAEREKERARRRERFAR